MLQNMQIGQCYLIQRLIFYIYNYKEFDKGGILWGLASPLVNVKAIEGIFKDYQFQ
jgi:hypothetical protein